MQKQVRAVTVILVLVMAYVLFFPRPTGTELLVKRRWVSSFEEGTAEKLEGASESSAGQIMPFRLGERFGYFSSEGEILFSDEVRYGLAQASDFFSNYSVVSENIVLQSKDGSLLRSIAAPGYPHVVRDRLYIFAPNGSSVAEWTAEGRMLWEREFLSVVTDLAAGNTYTAVALLDGEVQLLDQQGETIFSQRMEGSRLDVAFSVAMDTTKDFFAALVGVDPQQLIVFEQHSEGYFPELQLDLDTDYRRSVLLKFLRGGDLLVMEHPDGMLMYDRVDDRVSRIDLGGPVESLHTIPDYNLVLSLSGTAGEASAQSGAVGGAVAQEEVSEHQGSTEDIVSQTSARRLQATIETDERLISETLSGEDAFVRTEGTRIYLGTGGMLACIELVSG